MACILLNAVAVLFHSWWITIPIVILSVLSTLFCALIIGINVYESLNRLYLRWDDLLSANNEPVASLIAAWTCLFLSLFLLATWHFADLSFTTETTILLRIGLVGLGFIGMQIMLFDEHFQPCYYQEQ